MTDHFQQIYSHRSADYHRMICAEDADGNILAALAGITNLAGKRFLDLGTGTGRLPLLLNGVAGQIVGLDLYAAMLYQNAAERKRIGGNWRLVQGDLRCLPVHSNYADLTLAGWAISHMLSWFAPDWQMQIALALREMQRVTAPGGWLIILETLGTGSLEPSPPAPELAEYYRWLEEPWGFSRQAIRTDYQFKSVEQAVQNTDFFFGPILTERIQQYSWTRIPEWTGVWARSI